MAGDKPKGQRGSNSPPSDIGPGISDRPTGTVAHTADRKQTEQALIDAQAVVEMAMEGISKLDDNGRYVFVNQQYAALLGYCPEDLIGHTWEITVHPQDHPTVLTAFSRMLVRGKAEVELRGRRKDGSLIYKQVVIVKSESPDRGRSGHFCFVRDVTERKREEALQKIEKNALELVAKGTGLTEVLTSLCQSIEDLAEPMLCSVMLASKAGTSLGFGAGPSLPEEYIRLLDGIPIGPSVGSCGTSAYHGIPIIVEDISTHPLWASCADVVLRHGLRACWSQPIIGATRKVLGTFAAYYREPRAPQENDLKLVERVSHIAALAIEHARMTEALQETEARFQAFMQHSPAVTFIKDEGGRYIYVNPRFEELVGLCQDDLKTKTVFDFLPADVARRLHQTDQAVRSTGRPRECEETLPTHDGSVRHWFVIKFPLDVAHRRLLGGVAFDVTERNHVEESLLRTQFAMDQAVDAVYWIDPQAKILYTNEAASAMLGYSKEEFSRMTVQDLNPDFPAEVWPGWWEEVRQKKVVSLETNHLTKDRRLIPIDIRVSFLAYGGQEFHCAFVRDITVRKQIDAALRESQERFELAVSASYDGVWDWNILTGAQYWSDRHFELLGLHAGDLSPTYDTWISMLHPDDAKFVDEATQRHLRTREPYDVEIRVRMRDGSYRWFRDRGQAVWDAAGCPIRMVGSIADVTAARQAQEAIWKANTELEQRVFERTKELAATNRALESEIGQRKRVEERLQRTQYAVDHAGDQIFVIDSNGYFLDVNDSACRRLGYTKEELLTMSVMDIDPDFPPEAWVACWSELKRHERVRIETRHRSKSGEIYPVEVLANYLYHNGQELDCAFVRDVTERKGIEDRLQRTQYAVDHAADQIFVIGPSGYFLDVNDSACRRLGYTKQELLTLSVMNIDSDCSLELWNKVWAEFIEKKGMRLERYHRSKTGELYPVEVLANYICHQGQDLSYAIVRDVTERREAEDKIRESELRYKLLTDATFDGVALHDEGVLLEVNPGLEQMFGYGPGELIGRSILELVADESRDLVVANMRDGVSGPYEVMGRRKDGSTFPGEVVVRPHVYRGRQVRLVAGRDITARKQLEIERSRYMEELERQVDERTAEIARLESQRVQAEKLAAMGRLAAGVAHEINNPLAGIKNAFALVKQLVDPAHPYAEFADMIDREVARVTSIVQNMYQLYRPECGKVEPIELQTMIKDIQALFAKRLDQRRLVFSIDVDPCPPQLSVSRGDLLQILLNLLNNAIDCSRDGSVITLSLCVEQDVIRIAVADQGPGIPPEILPHIFDPFYTTKTGNEPKGMGLGLSVSQSLVAAMGGRIEVETQRNRGSIFSVLLPRETGAGSRQDHPEFTEEAVRHER